MITAKLANQLSIKRMRQWVDVDDFISTALKQIEQNIRVAIRNCKFDTTFTAEYSSSFEVLIEVLRSKGFTIHKDGDVYYDKQRIIISWKQPEVGTL